jgi:hypothetical protein
MVVHMKMFSPFLLVAFAACGGGGSSAPPVIPPPALTPPSIYGPTYISASSFTVGTNGGTTTIKWSYGFNDVGGDLASMVVDLLDSSGNINKQTTSPISGQAGVTGSSAVIASTVVPTNSVGTFTWRFHVVDAGGSSSNNLYSTYTITP